MGKQHIQKLKFSKNLLQKSGSMLKPCSCHKRYAKRQNFSSGKGIWQVTSYCWKQNYLSLVIHIVQSIWKKNWYWFSDYLQNSWVLKNSFICSCLQDYGELLYPPSALKTPNYWKEKAIFAINMFVWKHRSQTHLCVYDKFSKLLGRHRKNKIMNLHWYCCSTWSQSPLVKSLAPG